MNGDVTFNPLGEQINVNHIDWLMSKIRTNLYESPDVDRYFQNLDFRIWADEPNWRQYHAACWNALRNDKWTNMPFSPKALVAKQKTKNISRTTFESLTSAYSALWDTLAFGGEWRNPLLVLSRLQEPNHDFRAYNLTPNFMKFWEPMLETFVDWYVEVGQKGSPFPPVYFDHSFSIASDNEFRMAETRQPKFLQSGGWDSLHLTSHSAKPFEFEDPAGVTFDRNYSPYGAGWLEAPEYLVMKSDSYAGWGRHLLRMDLEGSKIVRIDVQVHESMPIGTTLGHVLVESNSWNKGIDDQQLNSVRYLNDETLIRFLETGMLDRTERIFPT